MTGFHPVPKPPARPKKARQFGSTLSVSSRPLRARGGARFKDGRCRPFLRWLATEPCFLTGCRSAEFRLVPNSTRMIVIEVEAAHLPRSRGAGAPDLGGAVPLARHLHREQHRIGLDTWLAKYGLTKPGVASVAQWYAERWRRLFPDDAAKYEVKPA